MIRYSEMHNAWMSEKNPDDQGMPTTNLEGDVKVCMCPECYQAYINGLGTNHDQIYGDGSDE